VKKQCERYDDQASKDIPYNATAQAMGEDANQLKALVQKAKTAAMF
jgi:hypothetical protein